MAAEDNIESNIPEAVAREAMLNGVTLTEREDDFLATSDKLIGQEFEATTARSALNKALGAMGIVSSDNVVPFAVPVKAEEFPVDIPEDEKLQTREIMLQEVTKPEVKSKAKKPKVLKAKVEKPIEPVDPALDHKNLSKIAEEILEVKPEPKAKKSKLKVVEPKVEEPKEEVKIEEKPKKKNSAKIIPLAEVKKQIEAKEQEKANKKKNKIKIDPKLDNGNGRERGKRWKIKEVVLKNPTMSAQEIMDNLTEANPDFSSSIPSINSIRLDFLATVRAAKGLGLLKDAIAKKIPDPKTQRNATALLSAVNVVVIEAPELLVPAVVIKVKEKGFKGFTPASVSASRAAIIESMKVMQEAKALK